MGSLSSRNFPRPLDDGKTPAGDREITYEWGEQASETPATLVAFWR